MSNEAVNWVYSMAERLPFAEFPAGPVALLVVLANFADQAGRCFASTDTLVARTRCDRRGLRRNLLWAEQHGLLSRHQRWEMGEEDERPHKSRTMDFVLHMELREPIRIAPSEPNPACSAALEERDNQSGPQDSVAASKPNPACSAALEDASSNADNATLLKRPDKAGISKERTEKQEIPGQDARTREGPGLAGTGVVESEKIPGCAGDAAARGSRDDFALVRSILPEGVWGRLDPGMVALVASKARQRIEAGWSAVELGRIVTSGAWPTQVHSWGHMVAARIEKIPLDCAPERVAVDGLAQEAPPEPWVAPPWQVALDEAKAHNEPGTGFLNRAAWVKGWLDAHPAEVVAWKEANPGRVLPVPPAPPARLARPADMAGSEGELVGA